jgi:hypothetical protein
VNDDNGKNLEGSGCGIILGYHPDILLERLRKITKNSVKIAGLLAES